MRNKNDRTTALLEPREKPNAGLMLAEIKASISEARSAGLFDRLRNAHRTRRCWWENQQPDGKVAQQKDKSWVPWKGAIDSRVPLAHMIVSELTMLQMVPFNRGAVEIKPRQTMEDGMKAADWTLVFQYYLESQMPAALITVQEAMRKNLRLLFDAKNELGYCTSRVRWRERRAMVERKITAEKLLEAMVAEARAGMLAAMGAEAYTDATQGVPTNPDGEDGEESPAPALTPEQEEQLVSEVRSMLETYMLDEGATPELVRLIQVIEPAIEEREAKHVARQLRRGNEAAYMVLANAGGVPEVTTLVPWLNCGHTMDLTEDGRGNTAFFEREIYTEATLKARAEEENWKSDFLDEVLKRPNQSLFDAEAGWADDGKTILNGTSLNMEITLGSSQMPYYEILRRVARAVDKAGRETIYETVLHGMVEDQVGKHAPLSQGTHEMMYVTHCWEPGVTAWLSRGVPEILLTMQAGLKKLYDAETCRAEIGSVPPLQVDSDNAHVRPMPGMVMAASRRSEANQFLKVPEGDSGAFRLRQELREWADEMFYRGTKGDPELKRAFREEMAAEAISTMSQIYRGMWKLIQRHTDPIRASRVAGQPVDLQATREDLQGDADVSIAFNIGVLSEKMATQFLDFGTKVMSADRSGAMDAFEFVRTAWQMFDPSAARRLVQRKEATTGAEIRDEQGAISALVAGQYPMLPDNVNFEQREKVMREWLNNPETIAMLQARPMLAKAVQQRLEALKHQRVQKTTNVQWGRTGQAPEPPWMSEEAVA